jgi:cytoskeletal protein RodZ
MGLRSPRPRLARFLKACVRKFLRVLVLAAVIMLGVWLIVEFAVSRAGKEKTEAKLQQNVEKSSET